MVDGVTEEARDGVNDVLVVSVTIDDGVSTGVTAVVGTVGVAVDGGTLVMVVGTPVVVETVDTKEVSEVAVVNVTDDATVSVVVTICVDGVTVPVTGGVGVLTTVEDTVNKDVLVLTDYKGR